MDILWRVFRILTEPVPYAFVPVNRRNSEVRVMWVRASLFRVDLLKQTYTELALHVPLKHGKLAEKYFYSAVVTQAYRVCFYGLTTTCTTEQHHCIFRSYERGFPNLEYTSARPWCVPLLKFS